MKPALLSVFLGIIMASCSVKPDPIHYGEDNCVLCQMTIMDHRYGTEIVTGKGKVFKFDSIECLVEYLEENTDSGEDYRYVLFTPFDKPGNLVDARLSYVLHSKNLPSPMGMFLTAFEKESDALRFKEQYGGKVYCWKGLNEYFGLLKAETR